MEKNEKDFAGWSYTHGYRIRMHLPGEKDEIEVKLIEKNASEFVLMLEDVSDEWLFSSHVTTENSSSTYFGSKEQGYFFEKRYVMRNEVTVFSNTSSAKSKFNEFKRNAEKGYRLENLDLGDESFFVMDRVHGAVFFRYRNVVAHLQILDFDEKFSSSKKEELIRYAKILEQKIKKAAEEQ